MPSGPLELWLLLAVLLVLSGACSASETALFSLTTTQRGRARRRVRLLLEHPRDLLVTVLLANLVVNILYFAFAARLVPAEGPYGAILQGLFVLVALLVFGEIVPKVLGLGSREAFARIVSTPLYVLVVAFGPLRRVLAAGIDSAQHALGRVLPRETSLTAEDLADVLEGSAERGHLDEEEADILAGIVELGDIRVREIMTPRVDMVYLLLDGSNRPEVARRAVEQRLSWVPVMDGTPDRVVGRVRVRDLFLREERSLASLVMPVKFVPEVASCLDLMQSLREDRTAEALVVDEWGGTAGLVTIEDLFEEIVGELRVEEEERAPAAVPLGEGRFRVSGSLSIRDWNDRFGLGVVPTEFETVGGFVTALLGRIPRHGDVVHWGELEMEVEEVRGRRVLSVEMGVRPQEPGA